MVVISSTAEIYSCKYVSDSVTVISDMRFFLRDVLDARVLFFRKQYRVVPIQFRQGYSC
eukprot:SAG11_NODE_9828_length_878_cov_0.993582_1_plen_58_part_10